MTGLRVGPTSSSRLLPLGEQRLGKRVLHALCCVPLFTDVLDLAMNYSNQSALCVFYYETRLYAIPDTIGCWSHTRMISHDQDQKHDFCSSGNGQEDVARLSEAHICVISYNISPNRCRLRAANGVPSGGNSLWAEASRYYTL